jgi:predicted transcriptional regulator
VGAPDGQEPGRHAVTGPVRVPLNLPAELKARVEELAARKHRSRNAQLVRLVEIGLVVSTAGSKLEAAERGAHELEQER